MGSKTYEICEIQGDGVGPEIMDAAKIVIGAIEEVYNINIK